MIEISSVVLHLLSNLYFICENKKQMKWMNENTYYKLIDKDTFDMSYFKKSF